MSDYSVHIKQNKVNILLTTKWRVGWSI